MVEKNKILIDKITIAGFRGYREPETIDFGSRSALLCGGNMAGKSSTLGAIEWCLFDEFSSIRTDRTRSKDELINNHCRNISVKLELMQAGRRIIVERVKHITKSKSNLSITLDDKSIIAGIYADEYLSKTLGLGYEDFFRAVYLHQEDMRAIMMEDRKTRSEAMDRLFGLEKLRNISDGLKTSIVSSSLSSLTKERDTIVSGISGRVKEAYRSLDTARRDAFDNGLSEQNLTLRFAQNLLNDAKDKTNKIAKNLGIEMNLNLPENLSKISDIKTSVAIFRFNVTKIRKHMPEDRELKSINTKISDLDTILREVIGNKTKYVNAQTNLGNFEKKNGKKAVLENKLSGIKNSISKLEEQKSQMDLKGRLIQAGRKYLEEISYISKCPICDNPVNKNNVIKHLQEEIRVAVSKELKAIESRIDKLENDKTKIEKLLDEVDDIFEKVGIAQNNLNEKIAKVSEMLKKPIGISAAIGSITKELAALKTQKNKLEAPFRSREESLQSITELITQADFLANVLKYKERCETLSNQQTLPELKKIENAIQELAKLRTQVEFINEVTRELQTELANKMIEKNILSIKKFYSDLACHPYYNSLEIDVETDLSGGVPKNLYLIKGLSEKENKETLASLKFSTGHMNCVGLSVFLALAREDAYSHNLKFLLMDDPSQNLDEKHKIALAKLLSKMCGSVQIIIATQDTEFRELLFGECKDNISRFEFGQWDIDGPKIEAMK